MTVAERKSVLEAWVKAAAGRMRVIAHVGGTCQADCIELARHAAGQGVDAVGAIAPFYFKPASVEELVDFYKPIAAAVAPIPFYTYHMPSVTGVNLPMKEFLEKGSRAIPNLNGIKFTSNNFMEMLECIRLEDGRFDILKRFRRNAALRLAAGARGGVGSTYNYSPVHLPEPLRRIPRRRYRTRPRLPSRNRWTSCKSSSVTGAASAAAKPS